MKPVLLMPFLDESESFTNGFECGRIWQEVNAGETFASYLAHKCNQKQIEMIFEHFGYEYLIVDAGEGWIYLTATPINISSICK